VVLALPGSTRREFSYRHEQNSKSYSLRVFLDARKLAFLVREGIVMGEPDGLPELVGKSESSTVKVLPDRPSWQIALLLLLAAAGYIISRLADSLGAAMEALFLALWAVPTITVAITLTKRIGSRWCRRHKDKVEPLPPPAHDPEQAPVAEPIKSPTQERRRRSRR
jgi:hypothetical protein